MLPHDTLFLNYKTHRYPVYMFKAEANRGTIVFLHGWHLPASDWWQKTNAIQQALSNGFNCICPDLDKCCYNDTVFNETDKRYFEYPTRSWIRQQLIPQIQDLGYLQIHQNNALVGISTGCRGAALIMVDFPLLFKKAFLISGDYDQTQMPHDGLMTACYGNFKSHKTRWHTIDNPAHDAQFINAKLILIHGINDAVVPYTQSKSYYTHLKKLNKQAELYLIQHAAHDYTFWNLQLQQKLHYILN